MGSDGGSPRFACSVLSRVERLGGGSFLFFNVLLGYFWSVLFTKYSAVLMALGQSSSGIITPLECSAEPFCFEVFGAKDSVVIP
jgi:hypothetical protein